jgi:SGNH hydrolase-like domain, acetyltransferase AlgX
MAHKLLTLTFLVIIYAASATRFFIPWADKTRPLVQALLFGVFHNPGEKAIAAPNGRLFYKQDVRYLIEPVDLAEPRAVVHDFREQLALRGIRLIVVPIPVKPNTGTNPGIGNIDLLPLLQNHYLAYDTHWTCEGAQIAAKAVADLLPQLRGAKDYEVKSVTIERRGDIVRMMDSPTLERFFPPETVPCQQVQDYMDDPNSPILVLGDSFLRIYQTDTPKSAGFIAHLARELKQPLTSIVNDGGASTLVRQELARKPQLLKGKKVVIWEFVERDLRFGTDGWQHVKVSD